MTKLSGFPNFPVHIERVIENNQNIYGTQMMSQVQALKKDRSGTRECENRQNEGGMTK